jgi:hypothetical protein
MGNLVLYLPLLFTVYVYDTFIILFALQRLVLPKVHAAVSFLASVVLVIALTLWAASLYETPISEQQSNILRIIMIVGSPLATGFIFWRITRHTFNWKKLILGMAILAALTAANLWLLYPHTL